MPALELEDDWTIPAGDLSFHFVRSSGPGGQNVNKLATKVELRFHLAQTSALSGAHKARLRARYPSHVTGEGDFLILCDRFRSQLQNQKDAIGRLREMILLVRRAPKKRVPTKATKASRVRRLETKRRHGDTKRLRRSVPD